MKLTSILILLVIAFVGMNITKAQDFETLIPSFSYKIIQKKVIPDTLTIKTNYYNNDGSEVAVEDVQNNVILINSFNDLQVVESINLKNGDTTWIANYEYSYKEQKIVVNYFKPYKFREEVFIFYDDSLYKREIQKDVFEYDEEDYDFIYSFISEYDSIGRLHKTYFKNEADRKYTLYEYVDIGDSLDIMHEKRYEDGVFVYMLEKRTENQNHRTIWNYYDYKTNAHTRKIDYIDNNGFLYKMEKFGSINITCMVNDPKRNSQEKPITAKPDEVYMFEQVDVE